MSSTRRQTRTSATRWAALALGIAAVAGCDQLLEVELPDAVTSDVLNDPGTAALQVNSVMAGFECAYSSFALDAAGYEDNFQRYSGVAGLYSEYRDTPGGGSCDSDSYSSTWRPPMLIARGQGFEVYDRITGWTDAQIPGSREELLATVALYNAFLLDVFGEHFCEFAIDAGPLLTPDQTLAEAEEWVDTALGHIASTGDFALSYDRGTITESIETMAHGLRARIRWARGDLSGAAADAALVPDGYYAYVLREEREDRRNMVSSMQGEGGGTQAAGFLQGPVRSAEGNPYGVTILGTNPVTGEAWPDPVPFTGYIDLAIEEATGRAIDDAGYPITTASAGTVEDVRVPHEIGNTAGGPDNVIRKYTGLSDDIPLISWVEMRLIRAEAEGGAAAIGHVNAVRTGSVYIGGSTQSIDLPEVTYVNPSDADQVENMIIEERRRGLWLEGRFWATKIQNVDKLWFPRRVGDWQNQSASYVLNGGVRVLMSSNEYEINPNLTLDDRGTGCPAGEAPVFN